MNQFNKDIIAALSSDKDITLNEVLRRQIEVTANQFLQNELTAVLGYEPHTRIDRSKDDVNYRNGRTPALSTLSTVKLIWRSHGTG